MSESQLTFFCQPNLQAAAAWLEDLLDTHKCWLTAAEILDFLGCDDTDTNKRSLRLVAATSRWIITGQKGYKHLKHADLEEIHHFCAWMESQAKQMADRAAAVRQNAHKIFG